MALNHSYNQEYTFVFPKLPKTVNELLSLPEARLDTPFKTAALAMLSLCVYKENKEISFNSDLFYFYNSSLTESIGLFVSSAVR